MFTSVLSATDGFNTCGVPSPLAAIAASSAHMQRAIGADSRSPRIVLKPTDEAGAMRDTTHARRYLRLQRSHVHARSVERMCDGAMLGSKVVAAGV
jgi:hypothetical protein